jgi:uncharacterized protein YecE (DUF72 family)
MYEQSTGKDSSTSQADVDVFLRSIDPLVRSGKLGALLAQFPPSFKNDEQGQEKLANLIETFGRYRLAVELRHRSWSDNPNTSIILKNGKVAWVHIDEPKFKTSVAEDTPFTNDMAYLRFHGRNAETWWTGDTETRYKYLYSPAEIEELAGKVRKASEQASLLFVFFNNHWRGYAPRNAVDIMKALQLPFKDLILRSNASTD